MCYITQDDIDNGKVIFLENGSLKFQGKVHKKGECEFEEGISFPQKMQEVDTTPTENTEVKPKKKPKPQPQPSEVAPKKVAPKQLEQTEEESPSEPTPKEDQMPTPVLAPQDSNVASPSNTTTAPAPQMSQEQLQLLLQTLVQQNQQHAQPLQAQQPQHIPIQPLQPSAPQTLNTEVKKDVIPEELHLFKQLMELTGGNALVAVLLVAVVVYMKFLKGKTIGNEQNEQKNQEQDEKIGEHTDVCDADRQNLSRLVSQVEAKVTTIDTKIAKLVSFDEKHRKLQDLDQRVTSLEESLENGLDLGLSDEVENRLQTIEKQLKALSKPTTKKETPELTTKKPTKAAKPIPLEDEESDE